MLSAILTDSGLFPVSDMHDPAGVSLSLLAIRQAPVTDGYGLLKVNVAPALPVQTGGVHSSTSLSRGELAELKIVPNRKHKKKTRTPAAALLGRFSETVTYKCI